MRNLDRKLILIGPGSGLCSTGVFVGVEGELEGAGVIDQVDSGVDSDIEDSSSRSRTGTALQYLWKLPVLPRIGTVVQSLSWMLGGLISGICSMPLGL